MNGGSSRRRLRRLRASNIRQAWIVVAIVALGPGSREVAGAAEANSVVSREPAISIDGGSIEHRRTVVAAVDRYLSVGLELPDLDIRIHAGNAGCGGKQGLFRPDGAAAVIDLCYSGEFLALHELGHAWEHFNLDDRQRLEFQRLTGATTWRSTEEVWRRRGTEQAANVLAHGLLSTQLESAEYHVRDFALFEALTGITTPRLGEIERSDGIALGVTDEQRARLAAYSAWRQENAAHS